MIFFWRIRAAIDSRLQPWLSISARRKLLDSALESLRSRMRGRVLEIGNGRQGRRGNFSPPVESASQWLFTDLAPDRRPDFLSDANKLPFADDIFDTIICLEVLEYIDNPILAMQEMRRVLKPGGTLILSMPFFQRWDTQHDYWRLTGPGLDFALKQAGFVVESVQPQGGPLAVIVNIVLHLLAKHPKHRFWRMYCILLYPIMGYLMKIDLEMTKRVPTFISFTTGYLVVASA